MKKIATLLFLFISLVVLAQKKPEFHLGCYSNGDTLTLNAVKNTKGVNLLGDGSDKFTLKQWSLSVTFKNGHNYVFKPDPKFPNQLSPKMKDVLQDKFKVIIHSEIKDIIISDGKTDIAIDPLVFYLNDKAFKQCDEKTALAKDDLLVKFSCFKNGETASVKDLLHFPTISTVNYNPQVDVKIVSFNFVVPKMDQHRNPQSIETVSNNGTALNALSFEMAKKLLPGEEFVLDQITVEFSNRKAKTKETVILPAFHIIIEKHSFTPCGDPGSDSLFVLEYSGKLLTGKDRNQPVSGQKVQLRNGKDTVVQITVTNSYGDFTFRNLKADEAYKISVPADDNPALKNQQLYLAKVDGTIVKAFEKSGNTFVYSVLPSELYTLSREVEEDTELKIKNFGTSTQKELTVIENIYYAPNSAEINDESQANLNKIVNAMNQNKALKLAISSHTDAIGDDAYNMALSERRAKKVMDYLLAKGIAKERMTAKGYGETQIKNRCKNGVDCSDLEHELNRRTEFKFTK